MRLSKAFPVDMATKLLNRDYARDVSKPQTAVLAIPGFTAQPAAGKAMFNWNLTTANLAWLDNHVASFGQGTGIGGGTLINGMVWTRGAKSDFDAWKSLGNSGWGWDDMLPYFMKVLGIPERSLAATIQSISVSDFTRVRHLATICRPRMRRLWVSSPICQSMVTVARFLSLGQTITTIRTVSRLRYRAV